MDSMDEWIFKKQEYGKKVVGMCQSPTTDYEKRCMTIMYLRQYLQFYTIVESDGAALEAGVQDDSNNYLLAYLNKKHPNMRPYLISMNLAYHHIVSGCWDDACKIAVDRFFTGSDLYTLLMEFIMNEHGYDIGGGKTTMMQAAINTMCGD